MGFRNRRCLTPEKSIRDPEVDLYVTLKEGLIAGAAAFSPDSEVLAVSSGASGYGSSSGDLQLVSLKRERWSPIVPGRSRTGDFAVVPPDAHVVVRKEPPATRIFDSGGAPLDDAGAGSYFSASGRLVARLEGGKQWVITDTVGKRDIAVAANGSGTIEFSPDERQVLVFPNIYTLDNPDSPQALAAGQPFHTTWSYPGAKLVLGVYADQIGQDAKSSVLFDWATGKVSAGPGSVGSLYAVSPDGQRFATYDHDAISIWAVGDSEPTVRSPERTTAEFDRPLYFSPDGGLLAVANCEGTPLFDTSTLKLSIQVPMRGCFAGFTLDKKYVVSRWWLAGFPEPTRHPITLEGVLEETCAKVRTNLTALEWERAGATAFAVATCPEAAAGTSASAAASK